VQWRFGRTAFNKIMKQILKMFQRCCRSSFGRFKGVRVGVAITLFCISIEIYMTNNNVKIISTHFPKMWASAFVRFVGMAKSFWAS